MIDYAEPQDGGAPKDGGPKDGGEVPHEDHSRQPTVADPLLEHDVSIAQVVADHHEVVYRYAFRLTGHQADAEDLTQQAFLIAQTKLHQLRDRSKIRSWLYTILRNCFLKEQRRRTPIPVVNLELDLNEIGEVTWDADDIDGSLLQAAIDELPADFKLVLVMFYFEECSYRDIAEKLEIPIGTVMSRLSRAKRHLRGRLQRVEASAG